MPKNTTNDMFAGFDAFAEPEVPAGAVKLQYGLSVQVVKLAAEATVAPEKDVTPAELAARYEQAFNMPARGLVVYADGREIPMDQPVPETAKTIEFRQPSGEKGADEPRQVWVNGPIAQILPLRDAAATIAIFSFTPAEVRYDVIWGPKAFPQWADLQVRSILKVLGPVIGLEKTDIVRLDNEVVKSTSTKLVGRKALSVVKRVDLPQIQTLHSRLTAEQFVGKSLKDVLATVPHPEGTEWKAWLGGTENEDLLIEAGNYVTVAFIVARAS